MITEKAIKREFVVQTIKADFAEIFSIQSSIISTDKNFLKGISVQHLAFSGTPSNVIATVGIYKKLRFQEIAARKGLRTPLKVYNKVVWPKIYGHTIPALKYQFTQDIRRIIIKRLQIAAAALK